LLGTKCYVVVVVVVGREGEMQPVNASTTSKHESFKIHIPESTITVDFFGTSSYQLPHTCFGGCFPPSTAA
jgi:hypothetical protein